MDQLLKGKYNQARRRQVRHRVAYHAQGHPQLRKDWPTSSSIGRTDLGASGVFAGAPLVRSPRRYRPPTWMEEQLENGWLDTWVETRQWINYKQVH